MPPVKEFGREFRLADRTQGYTGGRTESVTFQPIAGGFSLHAGLSYVQNFAGTPLGAAAGISSFDPVNGPPVILPEPRDWHAQVYGVLGEFTVGFYVAHGEMRGWFFFQVWV